MHPTKNHEATHRCHSKHPVERSTPQQPHQPKIGASSELVTTHHAAQLLCLRETMAAVPLKATATAAETKGREEEEESAAAGNSSPETRQGRRHQRRRGTTPQLVCQSAAAGDSLQPTRRTGIVEVPD